MQGNGLSIQRLKSSRFLSWTVTRKIEKAWKVLFINHIARLLKIKRPEPFEIEIPKTDTFSNDGSADDERTNDLLYGHELGGIDKGALVSFKS